MKRKITAAIVIALAVSLALSGCGETVRNFIMGNVDGEIGKTYSTKWFDFIVSSVDKVDEYSEYTPPEGYTLLDVVVKETNTFDEPITMGTFDFYLTTDTSSMEIYPLDPFNDDPTLMPEEFDLALKESAEYHMIFEFPADATGVTLKYTEVDEDDNVSATFSIKLPD
ncbi:MAG: hypothetical protein LBL49_07050 [Clostridiales Family XIII bacterium]|jgi:hypothetical protein|nr:hypothetical protein [Clostridiales Family XIII bacterium]